MPLCRLLVLSLLLAAPGAGAGVDPALFQDLHWRLLGPFRGGRVLAVAGVPGAPERFYFGSVNGGVWRTDDAGRAWRPIFDGQPVGSIGALAVAPSDPRVIYAGTGEADMRSDIAQGEGVYRSTDGGRSWAFAGLADSQQIGRVLVDPGDPRLVYVAALGHPYGANAERGVFRSRDGGLSWKKVLGPDDSTGAIDLAFEPGNPRVIYAALWRVRRTPWSVYPPASGPGGGLFKSTDGGDTWTKLGNGLPAVTGRIGIAVAPSRPRRVYAIVDAEAGGLYRSDDAGASWARTDGEREIWQRGWYFGGVTVEPEDPDVVYLPNVNLFRSRDGGRTFATVKGAPGGDDYHQLWIDPRQPARRILGVDQGAVVSVDGGATWSSWHNQPTGQFYHLATDDRFPYWVYGAQQDSGAAGVPSRTNGYDGINLTEFREVTAGGESDEIAPDPRDPETLFGGRVERLDLRTGQTRLVDPTLAHPAPEPYRHTWTLPLVFSRRDPRVLYFSNQRLFRTADGGEHWAVISPDLTREDPGAPANLDAATAADNPQTGPRRGVIYSIAPSRLADRDLWVGTDDGLIWRTRDEGGHWTNVTPPALTPWSKVGILEASHFDAETAYAAVDRHRVEDRRPYVYRTHDGGRSWQLAAAGIPDGSFVNAVREDTIRKGLLFAGTEKGVYVSFDDGDHWQPLQANLPVTSVRDLDVHGDDLVIATHGRAFWAIDDVAPLRQVDGEAARAAAWLFRPATAIRLRPAGFTGTPFPQDEPAAPNPPAGAYLDYVLKAPAKRVVLEVQDEHGGLVRRYASDDRGPAPAPLSVAPEWVPPHSPPPTTPGMHRLVWPLRYTPPAATDVDDGPPYGGVWAPPGRYTVVLDADGARSAQPLTVAPDPRLALPPAAYATQFALAQRIEAALAPVTRARAEADKLAKALAARRRGSSPEVARAIEALEERLAEVSGQAPADLGGRPWWHPAKPPTGLAEVAGRLLRLRTAVDGADAAPSPDAVAGFEQVQPAIAPALAAWEQVKEKDLAALNAELERAGEKPIATTWGES
jgi:photosystem II stability/assembly factor-like uncharacterized protein